MTVIVDPPNTEGHGRLWSHVASDSSFAELHAFAAALGVPERGFDRDHYDIPAELYDRAVAAGAVPVSSRELVWRLTAAGLRRPKAQTFAPRRPGQPLLRPPRLRPGDVVAVVTPAGPLEDELLDAGITVLRGWGLEVRRPEPTPAGLIPGLAGLGDWRAAQLAQAWTDLDVRAVWASRGGYGTRRLLDSLDWSVLASTSPRMLIGSGEITGLHQAVAARLGAATVHASGVAGLGQAEPATSEAVRRLVMDGCAVELTGTPGPDAGCVEGVLVGGSLTLLASAAGTSLAHPAAGGIALLEDVGERLTDLDGAVTRLLRSGWFAGVRALALGRFPSCGNPGEVQALLEDRLGHLCVPMVRDLPVGHGPTGLPVPLGVPARLDAAAGTLRTTRSLR